MASGRRTLSNLAARLPIFAALAAAMLLPPGAAAQTGVPPEVAARIGEAAAASRAMAARETAIAYSLGNPQLAATMSRKAQQRADTVMTSAVISIIAANRALAGPVVSAAVAEAPESRDAILTGVGRAFPRLGQGVVPVTVATARPQPFAPAPLGRAAPPPAAAVGEAIAEEEIVDPIEPVNRAIFFVNDVLDTLVFRPVAAIYGFLLPDFARRSARRFFDNLNSPVILANDLLQLTFGDAAVTLGRFAINTTVGVGGLFEVAEDLGLPPHYADFGQTLHSYGVGQGFYLVMPVFGPSTARDAAGTLVDGFFQPLNYILEFPYDFTVAAVDGISQRETLIEALDDLRANSIDFYAALRGAFYQNRAKELRKGREPSVETTIDALFEDIE